MMFDFLNAMKETSNETFTENGGRAYISTHSDCLDLFFKAGAMRNSSEEEIGKAVLRAYAEDPEKTMKIIFFARDVRGGLGERRFFRIAVKHLAFSAPESVIRNIPLFAEYGRFDDLCTLLDTPCEDEAVKLIKAQLDEDIAGMAEGKPVSLLAKWLPSVNASSEETVRNAKRLCDNMGMSEKNYRKSLSALRKYTDITENRLRVMDYTFDYEKQPSGAMFKYKKAFIRNDGERYSEYLQNVSSGKAVLHADTLYPYEIIRRVLTDTLSAEEKKALDVTWNSLPDHGASTENAIAVIDGSGSMTWGNNPRPIDAALSLGIYFAEHNKGAFSGHFITFSEKPRLVEVKGGDISEKAQYCASFNECANTNLEAVFHLILKTAVSNKVPKSDMPKRLYILSDMQFDMCVEGGNSQPLFNIMKKRYALYGYELPEIVFWNLCSRGSAIPVTLSRTGAALVSGFSPAIFDMVKSGNISPMAVMDEIIGRERYSAVAS
ncbi:MAG: DUF2828 family protein [Oscillospiraceae bacterium]|nr:DUF2828 family protein [Oscillospiraceae bacterium]